MGVALAVGAAFTLLSASKEHSATQERRRAGRLQTQRANVSNRRAIAKTLASRRAKVGAIRSRAANSGAGDSSSVSGGIGSINSQAFGEVSFSSNMSSLDTQANAHLGNAASLSGQAGIFSSFGNVAFGLQE